MRLVAGVAAIVMGCHAAPPPDPVVGGVSTTAGPETAQVAAVPAGWVAVAPPDEERLHCANYADDEWQVAIRNDRAAFTDPDVREPPDTGPTPGFAMVEPHAEVRARRHVLVVADGFLVGFDGGEWGGGLRWYSPDGRKSVELGDANVHGFLAVGPHRVAAIEGLGHLTISEGSVRWLELGAAGWRTAATTALDAAPYAFAATAAAIYLVTSESVVRVGIADRRAAVVQPIRSRQLYPGSMAIDAAGALWVGMRQFVVRLVPAGARFTETWLVRDTCVHATTHDLHCTCAP